MSATDKQSSIVHTAFETLSPTMCSVHCVLVFALCNCICLPVSALCTSICKPIFALCTSICVLVFVYQQQYLQQCAVCAISICALCNLSAFVIITDFSRSQEKTSSPTHQPNKYISLYPVFALCNSICTMQYIVCTSICVLALYNVCYQHLLALQPICICDHGFQQVPRENRRTNSSAQSISAILCKIHCFLKLLEEMLGWGLDRYETFTPPSRSFKVVLVHNTMSSRVRIGYLQGMYID